MSVTQPGENQAVRILRANLEHAVPWIVLGVLLFYSYIYLFKTPYLGFSFSPNGSVDRVFLSTPNGVQVGDVLVAIGSVSFSDLRRNTRLTLYPALKPGDVIPIQAMRDGKSIDISWSLPRPSEREIYFRIVDWELLALIFWVFGTLTLILIKPKGPNRRLLVAFNYLTAIWLAAGTLSSTREADSAVVMRMAFWLCAPVYLHLHWNFPQSLKRVSIGWVWAGYLVASALAVAEWFQLLPSSAYYLAMLVSVGGSISLLIVHALTSRKQRREVGFMAFTYSVVFLPSLVMSFSSSYSLLGYAFLIALPAIPAAYFFTIYRQQMGSMELRAHHSFILFIYGIILFSASTLIMILVDQVIPDPKAHLPFGVILALLIGLLTAGLYPSFRSWMEHNAMGMPLPPTKLLETYTSRITTSLSKQRLIHLIRNEVLPTLLIRQAALLRVDHDQNISPLFTLGISEAQLPPKEEVPLLFAQAGRVVSNERTRPMGIHSNWVILPLVLSVDGAPIGLCLLGKRDPDDEYSQTEIPILQALMDQAAVALMNIEQAEQLSTLYQADITRREEEYSRMAMELHDSVLGQMAVLLLQSSDQHENSGFMDAYHATVTRIREIVNGLRPGMLNYGLYPALEEYVDETSSKIAGKPILRLEIPPSQERYPAEVELHLFRIVQQGCFNAIKHAQANTVCIRGALGPDKIELVVEDDGIGFSSNGRLDFPWLLSTKHYGLASIHERAALIGARLHITSAPQRGTRIQVSWEPQQKSAPA